MGNFTQNAFVDNRNLNRNSGIELLKLLAIYAIVVAHVTYTLTSFNPFVPWDDYVIDVSVASADIINIILIVLRTFGAFGDFVFFLCSAWFLLDNDEVKEEKELKLIFDIWLISVVICFIVFLERKGNIDAGLLIKQFMPTWFENNWYMTCYLLFYPIHGVINQSIRRMGQEQLLLTATLLGGIYILVNFIRTSFFFSEIILWISIYYVVGYLKKYTPRLAQDVKINFAIALVGIIGNVGLIVTTKLLDAHFGALSVKMILSNYICSPFLMMASVGLFNIFRSLKFSNHVINYISGLSLFIYVIHENMLLRILYRPILWHMIYSLFGYKMVLLWVFVLSIVVFLFGVISSYFYRHTLEHLTIKASSYFMPKIKTIYGRYEKTMMKLR